MNVQEFSHVTINVSNLSRALQFYIDILQMNLVHRGRKDAYLEWGNAWICLQERPEKAKQREQLGVDHVAFYIDEKDFAKAVNHLQENNVEIVRGPMKRGLGWSINFLDPDGTQLELHTSTLTERMKVWE
ncbi:MAG TPA: VOC family protein [Anoxybacillus sp.]|jgi:catechol-2,3-dioxygenase|nr:VOC family protein [Anoxybacillus sp.]